MQEIRRRRATVIGLRARLPALGRALALALLVGGLIFVGVSYYRSRGNVPFRLRGGPTELSKEVVGRVENYERRVMQGGKLKLLLRASLELTFTDGHHELENAYLEVYPDEGDKPDRVSARRTVSNEDNSLINFLGNVDIETRDGLKVKSEEVSYDVKAETGTAHTPVQFERENVRGRADAGTVDSKNKKLELLGGVEITVEPRGADGSPTAGSRGRPVTVRGARADYVQGPPRLIFSGGATAEQERDLMSGQSLTGVIDEKSKKLTRVEARGQSYLRSMTEGRAAEIYAADFDFIFDADQRLDHATARRDVTARTLDADSEVTLRTAGDLGADFEARGNESLLRHMTVGGRPVVTMAAPKSKANDAAATSKRLTADSVKLIWRTTGRDLQAAEAAGDAALFVEPVRPLPESDRKTIRAARFDGEFYEAGNLARLFVATGGAKAVVDPVQPTDARAQRTLTSQRMTAHFERETQAVERVLAADDARFVERERVITSETMTATFAGATRQYEKVLAEGNVKFNERDRNAQAATGSYAADDEVLRLRGGEPTVWDGRARLKASEIDSDNRNKISYGRGKTATTYYSQEQTGGATPFRNVKSPVFIVSDQAEFRHETGVGIYTGNARAWQDDNFVKADRLTLLRDTKRMEAVGSVQSALYNARRKSPAGVPEVVPVFATSRTMFYSDAEKLLHYEGSVDIKQGTERITGGVADVFLTKDGGEVERTVAQRDVVITQPGKRGTGDWAQYNAAEETMVLTGNPARVVDEAQGASESRRLVVYLRDSRVVSDAGESPRAAGRVRSTHKIKRQE